MVRMCLVPSGEVIDWKSEDSNGDPRSVVTVEGTLKTEIQREMKVLATVSAVMSGTGIASSL